jgi:hypothetical protein
MTLPASGSISIQDIATELGVSLPLDINATNVRTLAGVASGNIVMPTDFYGKTAADPIPNAMDWANITSVDDGTDTGNSTYVENTNQTLAGINVAITLQISIPSFEVNCSGSGGPSSTSYVDIIKNGTVVGTLSRTKFGAGTTTAAVSTTLSVSSGDTLRFATYCIVGTTSLTASGGGGGTVSVINQSSSNTVLDTFTFATSATITA